MLVGFDGVYDGLYAPVLPIPLRPPKTPIPIPSRMLPAASHCAWRRCDATTPCTAADYSNVMAAKVYVLSRTLDQSREYTDDKTYDLGVSGTTTAASDHYKRHVYSTLIGLPNRSGPREPILAS